MRVLKAWRDGFVMVLWKVLFSSRGVSHFVNNFSRGCAFCTLNNVNLVPDESFPHLFYNCPTSSSIQQRILRKYFSSISNGNEAAKKAFLFGCIDNG
jgi:hypothetical protein